VVTSGGWLVLAAGGLASDPHAERVTANDAAQAASATEE
jgi:hypothetical protein